MEFIGYPKTPRLRRSVVITEKLDGTNAQVFITSAPIPTALQVAAQGEFSMMVGSRNRWITPGKETDNYGFAGWCQRNAEELFKLGEGQHFGEWYGGGIARAYGLTEKRFALFNTARWGDHNPNTPACCEVVPVLALCGLDEITAVIERLRVGGSVASPGFMNPEGVIVYHSTAKQNFKVLLENDGLPKGLTTS